MTLPMRSAPQRFLILMFALPVAWWLFLQARSTWRNYWLLEDGQQGRAVLTGKYGGGHGQVVYRYVVNGKQYTGVSSKDWKNPNSNQMGIGEEAVMYFSVSHPWLSLLYMPDRYFDLLPALIALTLAISIIVTAVNPKGKWALNFGDAKENNPA